MKISYDDNALSDLVSIGVYTRLEWGQEQWERYRAGLIDACERDVAHRLKFAQPFLPRPGVFYWRAMKHVIFIQEVDGGIVILRILHERMLPELHL